MKESQEVLALLREGIAASNRTTRAVRAFVRFLFIQLSGTTLAGAFIYFGSASVNVQECAVYGTACEPNMGFIVLGVLIWLVGVVWSSSAGWSELEKSDPSKFENQSRSPEELEEERRLAAANEAAEQLRLEKEEAERAQVAALADQVAAEEAEARRMRRAELYKKPWFKPATAATSLLVVFLLILNVISTQEAKVEDGPNSNLPQQSAFLQSVVDAASGCGVLDKNMMQGDGYVKISTADRARLNCVLQSVAGMELNQMKLNMEPKTYGELDYLVRGSWVTIQG